MNMSNMISLNFKWLFYGFLIISSCSSVPDKNSLTDYVENFNMGNKNDILFINIDACSNCFLSAVEYSKSYISGKDINILVSTKNKVKFKLFKNSFPTTTPIFHDSTNNSLNYNILNSSILKFQEGEWLILE